MAESSCLLQPTWVDHDTSKALDYVMEGEEKYYLEASALPLRAALSMFQLHVLKIVVLANPVVYTTSTISTMAFTHCERTASLSALLTRLPLVSTPASSVTSATF